MNQKISDLLENYEAICKGILINADEASDADIREIFSNALEMIQKLRSQNFRKGKWNRWFGYIQGILQFYGAISLDDIRDQTRPIADALEDQEELLKS